VPYLFAHFERKRPMRHVLQRLEHREAFAELGKDGSVGHYAEFLLPILGVKYYFAPPERNNNTDGGSPSALIWFALLIGSSKP
jgi:hypothetical protein